MPISRMLDQEPLTKEEYAEAFQQVRDGIGSLDADLILDYMKRDPVNAVYLFTEAVRLARDALIKNLASTASSKFRNEYAVWIWDEHAPHVIKRSDVLNYFDHYFKSPDALKTYRNTRVKFHECLFCGNAGIHNVTLMSFQTGLKPIYSMFDLSHVTTTDALNTFRRQYTGTGTPISVMGLCRNCYKPCIQCGTHIAMPRVTFEMLDSYFNDRLCANCGKHPIYKLPPPKLSHMDLKTYRVKFTSLQKGDFK